MKRRNRTEVPKPPKVTCPKREDAKDIHHRFDMLVNGTNVGHCFHDRIQTNNDSFWVDDAFQHRFPKLPYICDTWRAITLTCKVFGGYYVEQSGEITLDLTNEGMGWIVVDASNAEKPYLKAQMSKRYPQVSVWHATTFVSRELARKAARKHGGKVHRRNEFDIVGNQRWPEANSWFENLPPNAHIEVRRSRSGDNSCWVFINEAGQESVVGMDGRKQAQQQHDLDRMARETLIRRRTVA